MDSLDVHGLSLNKAIEVILKQLEIAYKNNMSVIHINHGFNNGRKIKTWCLNEAINNKYVSKVSCGINEGITDIYLKINIKKDL